MRSDDDHDQRADGITSVSCRKTWPHSGHARFAEERQAVGRRLYALYLVICLPAFEVMLIDMTGGPPKPYDAYQQVANALGVPVDTLMFVIDALDAAPQYAGDEPDDAMAADKRHCTAQELCNAVKLYAGDLWKEYAQETLASLGLRRSEDLGRIVFALVEAGLMIASDEDKRNDFNGVCHFDGFV